MEHFLNLRLPCVSLYLLNSSPVISLALETSTQGEREKRGVKYLSQEGLRGFRELQSFQPEASAGEGHGEIILNAIPWHVQDSHAGTASPGLRMAGPA